MLLSFLSGTGFSANLRPASAQVGYRLVTVWSQDRVVEFGAGFLLPQLSKVVT
jgi:hypothetical protein